MRKRKPNAKTDPAFFVPPARKVSEKKSSSGDSGGTFWQRAEPLPTDTIWRGNADRMPPRYTKDRKWNCPSCDVAPGKRHEQYCPRYLYQLNPYNASAYDDELFLANYMETQIWFGEGHPEGPTLLERTEEKEEKRERLQRIFEDWPEDADSS